jgi:preprotein translocase SecE subunit
MTSQVAHEGRKWIQSSVALVCLVLCYILISFFDQMGEWFEIESKFKFYFGLVRFLSVVASLFVFISIFRNEKSLNYLTGVFSEIIKVVWPDKNQTSRHTVIIIIVVTIIGFLLFLFDVLANFLLNQIR